MIQKRISNKRKTYKCLVLLAETLYVLIRLKRNPSEIKKFSILSKHVMLQAFNKEWVQKDIKRKDVDVKMLS